MSASARRWCTSALLVCLCAGSSPALAGRATDLASGFDEKWWAIDLRVGYERSLKRGAIKREVAGVSGRDDSIGLYKELRFSQVRHTLNLRSDFTFLKAIQLYFEFPIVLQDSRSLDFAQNDGDPCGSPAETNCVTRRNSTLVRDGFIDGSAMNDNQIAVGSGDSRPPGGLLLPNRSGIDQMYIGLAGMPLSQQRDSTKPTWVIGYEARISIGADMAYDPARPNDNTAMGRGVHQHRWWTSISRRYRYFDPWMMFFYMLPDTKSGSVFDQTTFSLSGQERSSPVQRGGGEIGVEIIPYDRPEKKQRLAIELSTRLEGVFEGRDYSEMWEVFAGNPKLAGPCRPDPTSYDPRRWNNGSYCTSNTATDGAGVIPFPGITSIENHMVVGGTLAFAAEITRFFRARIGVSLSHEQQHFITYGDSGKTLAANGKLDLRDEQQINPMYRPIIDFPGRRFRVTDTTVFDFFISAQGQF